MSSTKTQTTIPEGYTLVPIKPTSQMKKAAYYAGGVGDDGGADRASFDDEWAAAIKQHADGGKPTGLLRLVRPYGEMKTDTSTAAATRSYGGSRLRKEAEKLNAEIAAAWRGGKSINEVISSALSQAYNEGFRDGLSEATNGR